MTVKPTIMRSGESRAPRLLARIVEDIKSAVRRDPAARGVIEVLLGYPGVHAILSHRVAHRLWQAGLRFPARLLSQLARALTGVEIHPAAIIGRRCFIDHGMGVVIGETAVLGDDVLLYHGVTLGGTSLDPGPRHPIIGNDVIVGANALLLGRLQVGDGARIGAGVVVVKDVSAGTTIVGSTGRALGERRSDDAMSAHTARLEDRDFEAGAGI